MLEPLFNIPTLYTLALTLLHFLWQGLLISAALKLALLLIDKSKPQLRYALCALAMLTNLLVAIITFNIISPDNIIISSGNITPVPLTSLVSELTQQSTLLNYQELLPSILAYLLPYISLGWLAVILILVCKILIEIRNVNLLPSYESKLPSEHLQQRFIELSKQVNLHAIPKLLISMKVEVPMAIGFIKPVVLIPATMLTGLTPAQLEMLILHELAHIRRHDYLVNFLQTLIEILFFFHPSVHWIAKSMRNEREYCSDDIAVKHCGDPIAYAHTLTDTASLCINHQHTIPSMAMAASGGDLKQRVVRLVNHHCAPRNDLGKWFAAISLLLLISIFAVIQVLSSTTSQQWKYHLPWQSKYSASTTHIQDSEYKGNAEINIIKTQKNSIAQQLLIADNKEKNDNSSMTAINEMHLKDITPSKVNTINFNKSPEDLIVTNDSQNLILSNKSSSIGPVSTNNPSTLLTIMKNKSDLTRPLLTTKNHLNNPLSSHTDLELVSTKIISKDVLDLPTTNNEKNSNGADNISSKNNILAMQANEFDSTEYYQKNVNELLITTPYQINNDSLEEKILRRFKQPNEVQNSIKRSQREYGAKQLKSVDPVYPSLAKRKGIEIEVKVQFTIDKNGVVKNINFSQKNRLNYFKNSILTAMRKWRFTPAKIDNKAVESKMTKIFSFSLLG